MLNTTIVNTTYFDSQNKTISWTKQPQHILHLKTNYLCLLTGVTNVANNVTLYPYSKSFCDAEIAITPVIVILI